MSLVSRGTREWCENAMRVPVHDERHRITADRFFEPARSKERVNLQRLAVDRLLHRRIVQQSDQMFGAQPSECRLELQRFVDRFAHELLDDRFAPWTERVLAEAAAETLGTSDADPVHLTHFAVKDDHAGIRENSTDFLGLARFDVVVAEHGRDRHANPGQFFREDARFLRQPVVGEIPRNQHDVRGLGESGKKRLKCALRGPGAMQITQRGHTNNVPSHAFSFYKTYANSPARSSWQEGRTIAAI